MRPLKRILCIIIAILMMVTMIPGNYLFAAPGDTEDDPIPYNRNDTTNFPQYPNEGYVRVDKKAVWLEDEDNIAKVTMTLDGAGVKQGTDAVLVIDRSGSMDDNVNVTRTYEKEVEVEKQVPYNEVQLTYNASNVSHQYEERYLLILYRWQTATSNVSITLTAYVDDDGNYKGYKNVSVSGFHSTDRNYRLNSSSSSFSSWSQISNNNCANALISIFGGRTAAATVKGKNVNVIFPTTRSLLQSTQSSYTVMVKEMQTISETTSVKKMNNAKEAAKAFVDALLPEGNEDTLNRIAVVSYSSSGYGKGTAFEDSALTNDNASLKSAINGIAATGGTHIQAGIKMAQDILSESNAVNKYIVLVSDGEPTFSYRANAARQRTQTD
ncbi:MAG TPA: vWA domain-containing protein, partial [Sedimentibacter sp.]|nr:vWA domain-containing protein [Sedimentibacter sp.]